MRSSGATLNRTKNVILLVPLLFAMQIALAQSGTVSGKVSSDNTKNH